MFRPVFVPKCVPKHSLPMHELITRPDEGGSPLLNARRTIRIPRRHKKSVGWRKRSANSKVMTWSQKP